MMLSTLIFLQLLTLAGGVRLSYLFPFGEARGDVKLSEYKSQSFRRVVNLNGTYSFYSKRFSALQVHREGLIIFGKDAFLNTAFRHTKFPLANTPSLAVFYAPVQSNYFSEVFCRETRDKDVIERATAYVRSSFVEETAFSASHVFIVSWSNATRAYERFPDNVNTFQAVLITNGMTTFAMLNYQDDGLQWIKGYPVRFHGGRFFYAQVGFSAGDKVRYYLLPGSGTINVKLLLKKSNMMLPGQWMFKIGWPGMGPLNIESANSFTRKDSVRPHHFILDEYFTGCYKVHEYLLSNGSDTWKDMNTRSCMVLCHERNYRYAALQNDNQCACLNEPQYKKLEKLPTESCNARCMVNDEEICGDKTASSVFLAEARSTMSSDERTDALEDIDECSSGVSQCHQHASCSNSDPGYCCKCNEGYFGTGFICEKEGENLRFSGRMTGKINSVDLPSINLDVIAMTKDGRAYVVIRDPPASLQHSLKILTPFVNLVGWMFAVKKTMDVPNGIEVIGETFTRSAMMSFNSGEALYLNQRFAGKDATGSYISIVTTINGTMPNINADARVQVNSFKELYKREERGRVESNGAVTYSVDGQAKSFIVQQIIAYNDPRGCHIDIYTFNVESKLLLSKYDADQGYTGIAIKTSIVNGSLREAREKCEGITCGSNASCDDTGRCVCYKGFQGDGQRCKDADECKENLHKCHLDANCTNKPGSYSCHCKDGYHGDGFTCEKDKASLHCVDQNCHSRAKCKENKCTCNNGFKGDGVMCTDVNECIEGNDCDEFADCKNSNGSYTCSCKDGYQGNGKECIKVTLTGGCNRENCHIYASCLADPLSGIDNCACQIGFTGDGLKCQDLNECVTSVDICPDNKTECVNTLGSYECLCKKGFMEVNRKCVSDDACMGIECDPNALCDPIRGCLCKPGYQGNGRACVDEDECDPSRSPCDLNATCTNTDGSYQCHCRAGFTGDGSRCQRVDETCNGALCDVHSECIQPYDQPWQCKCQKGWQGNGQTCSDVDECESFKNLCHPLRADCMNTAGSYECRCKPGFQGDGINCTSDGSCHGVQCHDNATCFKPRPEVPGLCICKDGWFGDGRHCKDVDECWNSYKNSCHEKADCINIPGSYTCRCKNGFQGDGFDCVDVNECKSPAVSCDPNADCFNSAGSYQCRCRLGYQGNGSYCISDDTCDGIVCGDNTECIPRAIGSRERKCICKDGWTGDGQTCFDYNECLSTAVKCHINADCFNSAGSYQCRCRLGYQGNGTDCISDGTCDGVLCDSNSVCAPIASGSRNRKCVCDSGWKGDGRRCDDINECESPAIKCHLNADCFNSAGSYQCRCRFGYRGNGSYCVSDGTCDGVVCGENSKCVARASGSQERQCVCKNGWTGDGRRCGDIDECQAVNNSCHFHAYCINTPGSFSCRCKLGYNGTGLNCQAEGTCAGMTCHANATCRNTILGQACMCKDGFQGDGKTCIDVDECQTEKNNCDSHAECLNSIGSYSCHCRLGYKGNGFICKPDGTCAGIHCHLDATCEQGAGLVSVCVCKPGYRGDGRKCSDIDECSRRDQNCHKEAECVNTVGSYSCSCKLGFEGDGVNCKPDGTCAGIVCASDAECLTLPSNLSICKCKTGFFGDGLICKDIDECALRTHKCHKKAKCQNTLGSYACTCNLGYYGSGFNCSSDGTCEGVVCDLNADCVSLNSIGGPQKECMCKPGFTGRGDICKDIDECEHPSVCPDKADCFNMAGSFMCHCLPGYKMIAENCIKDCSICLNGGSCGENNSCVCPPGFSGKRCQWHGEASLIFSRGNSIQRMSLPPRPNNIGIIYQRLGAIHVGVDYDCVDQRVYWTEVRKGVIARARYDGSEIEVVVQNDESGSPEGIAVDWLGRNIYWTDSRLGVIQVARINGSDRRTLVSSDLANPRGIIVDPPNGKMYWTDWSQNRPKIEVANMDGTNRRILVKSSLGLPNGLTLVHSTNELCYSDAGTWSISCVNLGDLSIRKAYNPVLYPFGITNFNRTFFWTDWKLGRIQRMGIHSRFPDKPLRCFLGSSGKIFDIKAVQPCGKRTVASYQNPCAKDNGRCLGLCLLKRKSYSCSCPDGFYPEITANVTKCEAKCKSALGMETFVIKNEQISAHSAWNNDREQYGSSRARLHLDTWPPGWRAQKNDPSAWLQIDLVQVRIVTALATQGYGDEKEREWVKTYLLTTSRDGHKWISYKERGRKRVFIGNMDSKSVVQNQLNMPISTRWLRIVPRSWNNHIGMRVELYGC